VITNSGCEEIPGQPEPAIWICSIVNVDKAVCYHSYDPNVTQEKTIKELVGAACTGNQGLGELEKHHEFLHKKVKELESRIKRKSSNGRNKQEKVISP